MRFPRRNKTSSGASVATSHLGGTVRSTLKAKMRKSSGGKYSQKMLRRKSSKVDDQNGLPKLADLVDDKVMAEEQREDAGGSSMDKNVVSKNEHDIDTDVDADVEARDGPPEEEENVVPTPPEAEPVAPTSPVIFDFHAVASTSPAGPAKSKAPSNSNPTHQHRRDATSSTAPSATSTPFQAITQLLTPTNNRHKRHQSWGSTEVDTPDAAAATTMTTTTTPKSYISPNSSEESDYTATTALSIHSREVEMFVGFDTTAGEEEAANWEEGKEQKEEVVAMPPNTPTAEGVMPLNEELNQKALAVVEALYAVHEEVQAAKEENAETSETKMEPEQDDKDVELDHQEGASTADQDQVKAEEKEVYEKKSSPLTYITPLALAATSSEHSNAGELSINAKTSMRSTVLVEDADTAGEDTDNASTATGEVADDAAVKEEDIDDEDDGEDDGEDVYEEEGDYDGSLADESEEHVASPRNMATGGSRSGARKKNQKRRSKVNEKRLRDGHRKACKYLKTGDFPRALEEFEGILEELISSLGDSHRRVGSALHNVGIVNIRADNLDDAIDALEEAIRIRKDVHGADHPKVADSLLELGIALLSQKDYEDALEIFNDALDIREADLAEEARHGSNEDRIHCVLQVAKALNNIACVYFEYGSLSKALKTLEDVLEMQKEAIDELTERDPDYKQAKLSLATTYCNIGYVHADNYDWDNAIEFLDRAYAIQSKHLPEGSSIALSTLENLAYCIYKEKNLGISLEMYQEILLDQIELYGRYDISCAQTLHNIACIHIRQCEYEEALDQLNAAEDIQLDVLGEKSRRRKKTRAMISAVQYEMLKYPTVGEIFNRAMTRGGMKNPVTNKLLCSCGNGEVSELASLGNFQPLKPDSSSKMSGHKISYA